MNKIFTKVLLTVFVLALSLTGLNATRVMAYTPCDLYDKVWTLINNKFVDQTNNSQDWTRWRHKYDDKIKTNEDAYVAIDTMLASLNDPYTRFLDPKEFAEETKKHDAEWNKAHESEREQLKKTYKEAQQTYAQLETQRRDALLAQQKAEEEMRDLGKTADKTTASSVSLGQALSAVGRTDTILRQAKTAVDELGSSQEAAAERVSELEDELKQANSELETQRSSSRSLTKEIKEYEKELEAATKAAEEGYGSLEDLYLAQERLNKAINDKAETAVIITQIQERIKGLKKELQDASDKARTLDDVLSDLQKTSSSLRSEMASLAGSYQQLQNGQSLSLDTLMGLIEKYPEYSEMLIAAAGNVDLQKRALETLFEAKKNDYVITQEKALSTIEA